MTADPQPPSTAPPGWLRDLGVAAGHADPKSFAQFLPPEGGGRPSAVLVLFGKGPEGEDVLLIERAHGLRSHAGQPAFPGGAVDDADGGPVDTALREAAEETGLDPAGVEVLAVLPQLYLPPSGFVITPVLAWWHTPCAVSVADPAEVAAVVRVPVEELLTPANRILVRNRTGWVGPAFRVRGLVVWGFTAVLLEQLLRLAGFVLPAPEGPAVAAPVAPSPSV
ncbi:MAG: NUDIX hydrolase [Mycobacteriales bacterium]